MDFILHAMDNFSLDSQLKIDLTKIFITIFQSDGYPLLSEDFSNRFRFIWGFRFRPPGGVGSLIGLIRVIKQFSGPSLLIMRCPLTDKAKKFFTFIIPGILTIQLLNEQSSQKATWVIAQQEESGI